MNQRARKVGTLEQETTLLFNGGLVFQQFIGDDMACIDKLTGNVILIHRDGIMEERKPQNKGTTTGEK